MLITPPMRGRSWRAFAAAALLAAVLPLAGCAGTHMGDQMPAAIGGLPEGAPARPETPPAYPAVHDMPPARDSTMLSGAEQKKLEDELAAARARAAAANAAAGTGRNP